MLATPIYKDDFGRGVVLGNTPRRYGLYNLSSGATVSRFDVAKVILETLGRTDIELVPITSDSQYIRQNFPTPRPPSEAMRSIKMATLGLNCMRPWDVALEEYLRTAYKDDIVDSTVPLR